MEGPIVTMQAVRLLSDKNGSTKSINGTGDSFDSSAARWWLLTVENAPVNLGTVSLAAVVTTAASHKNRFASGTINLLLDLKDVDTIYAKSTGTASMSLEPVGMTAR